MYAVALDIHFRLFDGHRSVKYRFAALAGWLVSNWQHTTAIHHSGGRMIAAAIAILQRFRLEQIILEIGTMDARGNSCTIGRGNSAGFN